MAQITRLPTAEFLSTNWTNAGTIAALLTDGNTGTGTSNPNLDEDLLMEFADFPASIPGVSPITNLSINSSWLNPSAGADGSASLRSRTSGGTLGSSTTHAPGAGVSSFNYTGFTATFTNVTAFNGAQFGARELNYITNPLVLTELSAVIDYTVIGGGMIFLIGSLGPLVAVGMEAIPALAREIFRRTGTRLSRSEHLRLFRELRECRHPKLFFLGA